MLAITTNVDKQTANCSKMLEHEHIQKTTKYRNQLDDPQKAAKIKHYFYHHQSPLQNLTYKTVQELKIKLVEKVHKK